MNFGRVFAITFFSNKQSMYRDKVVDDDYRQLLQ